MGELASIPWLMALFSAAVFAVIAFRAGRNASVWALGWALYGLVLTTWIGGLYLAAYLPVLESESTLKFRTVLIGGLLIIIPAALFACILKPEKAPASQDVSAGKA